MEPTVPSPQPATPVPAERSMIPVVLAAGIVIALIVAGVLVLQILNRPGSAEDVARDFVVAVYEGDAERACLLTGPDLRQAELDRAGASNCAEFARVAAESAEVPDQKAAAVEILEAEEVGDSATVRVSAPSGSPGVWVRVDLERQDEEWLVTGYSG